MNNFAKFIARHRHGDVPTNLPFEKTHCTENPGDARQKTTPLPQRNMSKLVIAEDKKILSNLPSCLETIVNPNKDDLDSSEPTLSEEDCLIAVKYSETIAKTLKEGLTYFNDIAQKKKYEDKQLCQAIRRGHKSLLRIAKYVPVEVSAHLLAAVPTVLDEILTAKTEKSNSKPNWLYVEHARTLTESGFSVTLTGQQAINWLSKAEELWNTTFEQQEGTYDTYLLAGKCLRRKTDLSKESSESGNKMLEYYNKARILAKAKSTKLLSDVNTEISDFARRGYQYKAVRVSELKH